MASDTLEDTIDLFDSGGQANTLLGRHLTRDSGYDSPGRLPGSINPSLLLQPTLSSSSQFDNELLGINSSLTHLPDQTYIQPWEALFESAELDASLNGNISETSQPWTIAYNQTGAWADESVHTTDHDGFRSGPPAESFNTEEIIASTSEYSTKDVAFTDEPVSSTTVAFVKTWLRQFPGTLPSKRQIECLADLASVTSLDVEGALGIILQECVSVKSPAASPQPLQASIHMSPEVSDVAETSSDLNSATLNAASKWISEQTLSCPISRRTKTKNNNATRIYRCTLGCNTGFGRKDEWKRHEEAVYPQVGWVCFACENMPMGRGRVFYRKEHFVTHLKGVHKSLSDTTCDQNRFTIKPKFPVQCIYCDEYQFQDWRDRIRHLSTHLEGGVPVLPSKSNSQTPEIYCREKKSGSDVNVQNPTFVELSSDAFGHSVGDKETVSFLSQNVIPQEMTSDTQSYTAFDDSTKQGDCEIELIISVQKRKEDIPSRATEMTKLRRNRTITGLAKQYLSSWTLEPANALIKMFKNTVYRDRREQVTFQSKTVPSLTQSCSEMLNLPNSASVRQQMVMAQVCPVISSSKDKISQTITLDSLLKDEFLRACIRNYEGVPFVPNSSIKSLITTSSILNELDTNVASSLTRSEVNYIKERCYKLFAILVLIRKSNSIAEFLREGLSDECLPLSRKNLEDKCIYHTASTRLMTLASWSIDALEEFCRIQWTVVVPIFPRQEHVDLGKNMILPFLTLPTSPSLDTHEGGYSRVYPVTIHPDHHTLWEPNSTALEPILAVKQLYSSSEQEFQQESDMLRLISTVKNKHLIKLLTTYKHNNKYHFLFPYANSNLRSYWEKSSLKDFVHMRWVLEQLKGLAGAVNALHEHEASDKYWRHGDLKPENILWFSNPKELSGSLGRLVIADFGAMKTYPSKSHFHINPSPVAYTPTYAPPELTLLKSITCAYDIWSLGCVYLEFICWILMGSHGPDEFSTTRTTTGHDGIESDAFYEIIKRAGILESRQARLKPEVTRWIGILRDHQNSSQAIHDLLSIIEYFLLVVDSGKRATASQLHDALAGISDRAKADTNYLMKKPGRITDSLAIVAKKGTSAAISKKTYVKLKHPIHDDMSTNNTYGHGSGDMQSKSSSTIRQGPFHSSPSISGEEIITMTGLGDGEEEPLQHFSSRSEKSRNNLTQDDISGDWSDLEPVKRRKLMISYFDLMGSS